MDSDISTWDLYEDRVVESTSKILRILDESNTKATFFVLGYVAEHFPELIEDIKDKGHEIATHGYSHTPITEQTPTEFEEDLSKSIRILEHITKDEISGHRACEFSINEKTSWAVDILMKNRLKYDSSMFPVKTPLYGVPDANVHPYHISSSNIRGANRGDGIIEFPLSIYRLPFVHKNIPIAGGFYLRLFPYYLINYCINKINKMDHPAIVYVHPWEFDSNQPKVNVLKPFHYYNLSSTENKFRKLLKDFRFTSVKGYFEFLDQECIYAIRDAAIA